MDHEAVFCVRNLLGQAAAVRGYDQEAASPAGEQPGFCGDEAEGLIASEYGGGRIILMLAEAGDDPLALAQTQNLLGILDRFRQNYQQALGHLEQSLSYTLQLDNPQGKIAALNNLALVQADLDDAPAALKTILQAIDEAILLGDRHLEAALRSNYADILRSVGDTDAAMQQLKQSAVIFTEIGMSSENWEPEIWKLVEW